MTDDATPTKHELKSWPEYFDAVWVGTKTFEVRPDDRTPPFALGDGLLLREWRPGGEMYTGREIDAVITYIMRPDDSISGQALKAGWVVLGITVIAKREAPVDAPKG